MTDLHTPIGTIDDQEPVPDGWDEVYENWRDYDQDHDTAYNEYDYSYEQELQDMKDQKLYDFFDRWGYYPDEETPEQAALRAEQLEEEEIMRTINYQSQQGATTNLGELFYKALTAK